jgi:hypothetical protein
MHHLRWIFLLSIVVHWGCNRHPASTEDCEAIVHRLVELELRESGYRDPTLRTRWQEHLTRQLAPDLVRCRGRKVRSSLRACIAAAQTSEEIAHRCLD